MYYIFTTKFKYSYLDQIPASNCSSISSLCLPLLSPGGAALQGHGLVSDGAPGRGLGPLIGSQSWCRLLQADGQRLVDAVQVSRCSTSTLGLLSPPGLSQFLPLPLSACLPLRALIYAEVEIWSRVKQANWFLLLCWKHLKRISRQVNGSFCQDCMNLAHVTFCLFFPKWEITLLQHFKQYTIINHTVVTKALKSIYVQQATKPDVQRTDWKNKLQKYFFLRKPSLLPLVKYIIQPHRCCAYKWTSIVQSI